MAETLHNKRQLLWVQMAVSTQEDKTFIGISQRIENEYQIDKLWSLDNLGTKNKPNTELLLLIIKGNLYDH